jgi:hypothetical protein
MNLREIGVGVVNWIRLAQDRDRWRAVECGDEPSGSCATESVGLIGRQAVITNTDQQWLVLRCTY